MTSFLQIAIDAAKASGELQMEKLGKDISIEYKSEINLVTEVDKACEKLITEKIAAAFPNHDFLAEEGTGQRTSSEYKWIIDPLDGTTNYAHGYPLFCTSIALEYKGEIILGVVYEPNLKELFYAEKGKGSFLNGKPIKVSGQTDLQKSLLSTGFAYNIKTNPKNNITHFKNVLLACQGVRRDGVAAVDLCYVACGRFDGFWELNLFPWDVAAGALIVTEAGGVVTKYNAQSFSVYDKEIVASTPGVHQAMVDILKTSEIRKSPLLRARLPIRKSA